MSKVKKKKRAIEQKLAELTTVPLNLHAKPDFLIIGAQKGGTSALRMYLNTRENIISTNPPEVHFFSNNFSKGKHWYHKHFPIRKNGYLYVDKSPTYLRKAAIASKNIYWYNPFIKMIAVLRDPVIRAFSAFNVPHWKLGNSYDSFEIAIESELSRYYNDNTADCPLLQTGLYSSQLKFYFDLFPSNQIFVLKSEDLKHNTLASLNQVAKFINIPEFEKIPPVNRINKGSYKNEMPQHVKEKLKEFYYLPNEELKIMTGINFNK